LARELGGLVNSHRNQWGNHGRFKKIMRWKS
jgi:hypothetical protein